MYLFLSQFVGFHEVADYFFGDRDGLSFPIPIFQLLVLVHFPDDVDLAGHFIAGEDLVDEPEP